MVRMTEKSRVLARYGPDIYKDVFKVKKTPSKARTQRARSKWIKD